jgi:anaerobic selenocysteine-containing dehydrogenase
MPQIRHTYCRICESACCLAVTVETDAAGEGRIVRVTPDKQHPASRGFACVKGIRYGGIHHDKERVNPPPKRIGDRFQRITWKPAIAEICRKTKALKRKHGPRPLAHYMGNPSFFDLGASLCLPESDTVGNGSGKRTGLDCCTKNIHGKSRFGALLMKNIRR